MTPSKDVLSREILNSIDNSVLCWLATVSDQGQPNVSPKEVFTAWEDKILIANIASPQTMANLKSNPQVCISFVDVFVQKGFQLKGSARIIHRDHEDFAARHDALFQIAGPDFPFATLIEIQIESTKPIVAPRYRLFPETTEADQIESAMKVYGVRPI
ncbi:MAG: pyridoxamine 5'-phosphate oxidase family protein [Planctomycetota bacterium]